MQPSAVSVHYLGVRIVRRFALLAAEVLAEVLAEVIPYVVHNVATYGRLVVDLPFSGQIGF